MVLGIDRDREATETHRHHFGGLTLDWDLGEPERVARVAQLVEGCRRGTARRGAALPAVLTGRAEQDPAPDP